MAVAEGVHELAEGGGALDLEKDLVVVVGDLDVQVFDWACLFGLVGHMWRSVLRHGEARGCAVTGEVWRDGRPGVESYADRWAIEEVEEEGGGDGEGERAW